MEKQQLKEKKRVFYNGEKRSFRELSILTGLEISTLRSRWRICLSDEEIVCTKHRGRKDHRIGLPLLSQRQESRGRMENMDYCVEEAELELGKTKTEIVDEAIKELMDNLKS